MNFYLKFYTNNKYSVKKRIILLTRMHKMYMELQYSETKTFHHPMTQQSIILVSSGFSVGNMKNIANRDPSMRKNVVFAIYNEFINCI